MNDLTNLTFFFIDEPLLLSQEAYFDFVRKLIMYLNYEGRLRAKEIKRHALTTPTIPNKPPYFTRKG